MAVEKSREYVRVHLCHPCLPWCSNLFFAVVVEKTSGVKEEFH